MFTCSSKKGPNSDIVSGCLRSLIRAAVYFLVFASILYFLMIQLQSCYEFASHRGWFELRSKLGWDGSEAQLAVVITVIIVL